MLEIDPEKRIKSSNILKSDWIKNQKLPTPKTN